MITANETVRQVRTSGLTGEVASYHINPDNIGHITAILRDMYSDPVLAVVREYCANALDAHQQVGKEATPIQVTPPTILAPAFVVRDFGPGLSSEQTKSLLLGYASSGEHKRNSNAQVGGFGIGCKCAFSVADQFKYTVFFEGRRREWSCYLDESDIGRAVVISDEETTEPSGIEVQIPVRGCDIEKFRDRIASAFLYYPTQPEITEEGFTLESQPGQLTSGTMEVTCPDGLGNDVTRVGWVLHSSGLPGLTGGQALAQLGPLAYPIDVTTHVAEHLPDGVEAAALRDMFPRLRLIMPIGWLQVAPSRETLQYSKKTTTRLTALFKVICSPEFFKQVSQECISRATGTGSQQLPVRTWCQLVQEMSSWWPRRLLDRVGVFSGASDKLLEIMGMSRLTNNSLHEGPPSLVIPSHLGHSLGASVAVGTQQEYLRRHGYIRFYQRVTHQDETGDRMPDLSESLSGAVQYFHSAGAKGTPAVVAVSPKRVKELGLRSSSADTRKEALRLLAARTHERLLDQLRGRNQWIDTSPVNQSDKSWRIWFVESDEAQATLSQGIRWLRDGSLQLLMEADLDEDLEHPDWYTAAKPKAKRAYVSGNKTNYAQHAKKFVSFNPDGEIDGQRRSSMWNPAKAVEIVAAAKRGETLVYTPIEKFKMADFGGGDYSLLETKGFYKELLAAELLPSMGLLGVRSGDVASLPTGVCDFREYVCARMDAAFATNAINPIAAEFAVQAGKNYDLSEPQDKVFDVLQQASVMLPKGYSPRSHVLAETIESWETERAKVTPEGGKILKYVTAFSRATHVNLWESYGSAGSLMARGPKGQSLLGTEGVSHLVLPADAGDRIRRHSNAESSCFQHSYLSPRGKLETMAPGLANRIEQYIGPLLLQQLVDCLTALPFTLGSLLSGLPLEVAIKAGAFDDRLSEILTGYLEKLTQDSKNRIWVSMGAPRMNTQALFLAEQRP